MPPFDKASRLPLQETCSHSPIRYGDGSEAVFTEQLCAEQAQRAAEVALQLALALGRADVLWQEAFPRFAAAHQIGSFMRALVPCILSGRLSSLAPEVVQVACPYIEKLKTPMHPECYRLILSLIVGGTAACCGSMLLRACH